MLFLLSFPDPRLKHQASAVDPLDPDNATIVEKLQLKLEQYGAYGVNAPMFGILKSIVVLDNQISTKENQFVPKVLLNPKILASSAEMKNVEEGSLCFQGISADVSRPVQVTISYQDLQGQTCEIDFDGFSAAVVQHQMDHLIGKSFLDHISPLKKSLLLKKMTQMKKQTNKPHVHGPHCHHN